MNFRREIEIVPRFRKAVDLALVTNQYRQKLGYNITTIFKFSFVYSLSINN